MEEKKCNCSVDNCLCGDECNCDENCSCGCNNPLIIELEDDEGNKTKGQILGTFESDGKNYAVVNDLSNGDDSYIFEIQSSDNGDELVSIDDEQEFERLCKVVEEIINKNKK